MGEKLVQETHCARAGLPPTARSARFSIRQCGERKGDGTKAALARESHGVSERNQADRRYRKIRRYEISGSRFFYWGVLVWNHFSDDDISPRLLPINNHRR